jgi:hypothetical protein
MELIRAVRTRFFGLAMLVTMAVLQSFPVFAAPGSALQFDGVGAFVQVGHDPALNAFPFTASAWFRTTNNAPVTQGIVCKYFNATGNGLFIIIQNGKLRGYFSVTPFNTAIDVTSAGTVADGFWHHVALVVDKSGGKLFLDGIQIGANTWSGAAGPFTTSAPLLIGQYDVGPNHFLGTIDEVTLWNRALDINEVNYLKHRQLNGNEDGLVALWHFDENTGLSAGDSTGHGYLGSLQNNPVWISSSAPVVFNQIAVNALALDGTNGYVVVNDTNDLSGFPFTAMAWFRTTNNLLNAQGIVSKYADASANGWTIVVQSGQLRAFFYRNGDFGNYAIDATSAGTVADGAWHHAALTVDASGGKLYLDGSLVGQSSWSGPPGGTSSSEPLQIGRYYNYDARFAGAIDEVAVWNRALSASEVQSFKNVAFSGSEAGLVACWHLNEGSGTNAADATGLGHTGILTNNPAWVGSTAFLGDGMSTIHTTLGALQWLRTFAVKTIPSDQGFSAAAPFWVRRLDDFGAVGGVTNVAVTLQSTLQGATAGTVTLVNNSNQFNFSLSPFLAAAPQATAGGIIQTPTLNVQPSTGTQLDSVNDTFQLGVTETY